MKKKLLIYLFIVLCLSCKESEKEKLNLSTIEKTTKDWAKNIIYVRFDSCQMAKDTLNFYIKVHNEQHLKWASVFHKSLILSNYGNLLKYDISNVSTHFSFYDAENYTLKLSDDSSKIELIKHLSPNEITMYSYLLINTDPNLLHKYDRFLRERIYKDFSYETSYQREDFISMIAAIANNCDSIKKSNKIDADMFALSAMIEIFEGANDKEHVEYFKFFYDYCSPVKWKNRPYRIDGTKSEDFYRR